MFTYIKKRIQYVHRTIRWCQVRLHMYSELWRHAYDIWTRTILMHVLVEYRILSSPWSPSIQQSHRCIHHTKLSLWIGVLQIFQHCLHISGSNQWSQTSFARLEPQSWRIGLEDHRRQTSIFIILNIIVLHVMGYGCHHRIDAICCLSDGYHT